MINLDNKTILITGGTGSFGRNFTEFLLKNTLVKKIIIFSRDELKQSQMRAEMKDLRLRFFLGDVRDPERLERAFRGVDIVVHAAALKQVPTLEYNPFEAVKTNILGSQNVINAAINQKVAKTLLISTDKAVQPINLYGSTKLCAEKLFISGNSYSPERSSFSVVRYGNVIGSRGSIVENLINYKEGKVKITDLEMTRFWINLKGACDLVMYALENMLGGEIFVPNIPSMKLVNLFDALAPGAEKEAIGIRPGEKLHEILLTVEEARRAVQISGYFIIIPDHYDVFDKNKFDKHLKAGQVLPKNFVFSSDTNQLWLTKDEFLNLIKQHP